MREDTDAAVDHLRSALRRAQAAALVGHALECAVVAAGAFLAVFAACRFENSETSASALASAFSALFAFGAAWWEGRPSSSAVVARLDARLGLDGALVTFDERGVSSPFGPLLARRVEATQAVLPRRALRVRAAWFAAAGLCAALCAWVHERAPVPAMELAALDRAAEALAGAARRTPAAAARAPEAQARALAADARELADRTRVDGSPARADARALAERVARLEAELPEADPRKTALAEARAELRRLAPASTRGGSSAGANPVESGAAPGTAGSSGSGVPSSGASSTDLAPMRSAASSAYEESGDPVSRAPTPNPSVDGADSGPAVAGTWWDPRYDAVVSRWIEARRVRR